MITRKTQNANETLNGMIWEGLPKIWHCGLQKLEIGVYDVFANFNYPKKACRGILSYMKIVCEKVKTKTKVAVTNKSSFNCKKF